VTPADLLGTLAAVAIVLAAAHLGGLVARMLGQPAVIGQLAAGVVLGPTVLGLDALDLSRSVLSPDTKDVVEVLGTIGLVAFAFAIGARVDPEHLPATRGLTLMAASVFAVPFLAGLAVALALYGDHSEVGGGAVDRLPFALFVGAAISITAFPVLVRIVEEHGLAETRVGSLAVSCAAVNDVLSWIALSFALLAHDGTSGWREAVAEIVAAAALVAALAGLARLADRTPLAGRLLEGRGPYDALTIAVVALGVALTALATSAMGLHYVFGAFAFGAVLARPSLAPFVKGPVRVAGWVAALLLPLFLVLPGASIDFRELDLAGGGEILLVTCVAVASKLAAGALSARSLGLPWHDAVSLGVLLNTRGLVELVALGIGEAAGILDTSLYAVLVIMAVVTTVATSPGLRLLGIPRRPA
jgi:Kef-type K+ transport system membrane component KefB